jgi:RHS repeat-associated protein
LFPAADPHKIPIDPNGNLTTKTEGTDSWTYSWNAENQLTKVEKNGVELARFAYDPLGRRVEKVAGGVTASYSYDGEDILRELRGSTLFKYVHGLGIDEPLGREDGSGALAYYHTDGLGSIVKRTSQAGTVVSEYRYDAWGNIELGAAEPGYSFTGREWDPEAGLYYYRARYYDARLGRFIGEDPIGFDAGVNFYAYVGGNPTAFADPTGTVGWNVSEPTWQPVTWEEARRLCGGRGHSYGCNILKFSTSCQCKGCGSNWKAQIDISATNWHIYYATDGPRSADRTRAHEKAHYDVHMKNLKRVRDLAEQVESHTFRSQEECEAGCTLFENRATMFMISGHWWLDFLWQFGF